MSFDRLSRLQLQISIAERGGGQCLAPARASLPTKWTGFSKKSQSGFEKFLVHPRSDYSSDYSEESSRLTGLGALFRM